MIDSLLFRLMFLSKDIPQFFDAPTHSNSLFLFYKVSNVSRSCVFARKEFVEKTQNATKKPKKS